MLFTVLLSSGLALGIANVASAQTGAPVTATARGDLAATATLSDKHTTVLKALKASGLEPKAHGTEKYTVFAPTNAAFDQLPAGQLDELMKPANKSKLAQLLSHHVVRGSYLAANLTDGLQLQTVLGETLTVHRTGDTITLSDANGQTTAVVNDDIIASNGIIHSVNTVLLPTDATMQRKQASLK
jgi:uncharacterized surface protein with fasciclin (FAS1) repeats